MPQREAAYVTGGGKGVPPHQVRTPYIRAREVVRNLIHAAARAIVKHLVSGVLTLRLNGNRTKVAEFAGAMVEWLRGAQFRVVEMAGERGERVDSRGMLPATGRWRHTSRTTRGS